MTTPHGNTDNTHARKGLENRIPLTIKFPPHVKEQIRTEAAKKNISQSDLLILLIYGDTPPLISPSKQ